ncbi:DNA repair protein RecO [Candidatus Uhrbacteria bacterium]|nr:DNA repair protein RecO [Candidatus Uhrbacteria bacterium]
MRNSSLEILVLTYSTSAIILRRRDIGEWDRLYIAYTREHGKLSLLGKGTRRSKAKLASHLEPYAEVDLVIARGKAIDRITFARTIRSSATIAVPYERVQVAAYIAECVDHLTRDQHRDVALFDLLRDALEVITQHHSSLVTLHFSLVTPFTLRLLSILGYTPQLDRCVECRTTLPNGPVTGVPLRGGLVCQPCTPSSRGGTPLTDGDREHLAASVAAFRPFSPSMPLITFTQGLLEAHLWQPLRTTLTFSTLTRERERVSIAES